VNGSQFTQLVELALAKEREAAANYDTLAKKVTRESSKKLFLRLAQEERKHEEKLKKITPESLVSFRPEKVVDLHLADKLDEPQVTENLTYLQSLTVAIKREERALEFYRSLSEVASGEVKNLLLFLAQEEAKHKFQLETEFYEVKNEYDWNVRPEEI
jgi:rubrerythrin